MSEAKFLKKYDAKAYPIVLVTVDTVLLTYHSGELKVLMVKRANHPCKGKWGLPGGFLNQEQDASLAAAAARSVRDKTGVDPQYLEQIETLGSCDRDPRGWSVSVIYSALIPYREVQQHASSVEEVTWMTVESLSNLKLAFDHEIAIDKALNRHKQKALYSFIPVFALEQPFTITDLRKVHEALIGHDIQRKSFIRRVEASNMFVEIGDFRAERGRPAAMYSYKDGIADYRFIRNIESS